MKIIKEFKFEISFNTQKYSRNKFINTEEENLVFTYRIKNILEILK